MPVTPDGPACCPLCRSRRITNENSIDGFWKWKCAGCRAVFIIATQAAQEWIERARKVESETRLSISRDREVQEMAGRAFGYLPNYNPLPLPSFMR